MRLSIRPSFARALMPAASVALISLMQASPAHSHAIESTLERLSALNASLSTPDQDKLLLQSRFGNGEPAAAASVRLVTPTGGAIEIGRTDSTGQLRFKLPRDARSDWEVQIDAGPGHRDYLELPDSQSVSQSPSGGPMTLKGLGAATSRWLGLGLGLCAAGMLVWRQRRP